MADFRDEALNLGTLIGLYKRKEHLSPFDYAKEISAENNWGASFLYASLQLHTGLQVYHTISKDKIDEIYKAFNQETGLTVNLNELFRKNWLRIVNQKVKISGVIRYGVFYIDKVANLKNEFDFLSEILTTHEDGKVEAVDFDTALATYSMLHSVNLDREAMIKGQWVQEKEDVISIQNIDYYRPVVEHLEDFLFIKKVCDCLGDEMQNKLFIPKQQFADIYNKHITLFPLTPPIQELENMKVVIESGDDYGLNFRYSDSPFTGLIQDKAGAILWNLILAHKEFGNDVERLRYWYDRMVHHNHWCSIGKYFTSEAKKRFLDAALTLVLADEDLISGEEEYMKIKLDQGHRISNLPYVLSQPRNEPMFPSDTNLFSQYTAMEAIDERWQHQLMWSQDARESISYYIHQIVVSTEDDSCNRLSQLLEAGSAKPYILWETCWNLYYWTPHLIPYLLYRSGTSALGFSLLWKLKESDNALTGRTTVFEEVALGSFRLLCRFLSADVTLHNAEKAKIIFQCLSLSVQDKMKIIGPDPQRNLRHKEETTRLVDSLCTIFGQAALPGRTNIAHGQIEDLWHPQILNELYTQVVNFKPVDYYRNNTLAIPHGELYLLEWLMKIVNVLPHNETLNGLKSSIIGSFNSRYLNCINTGRQQTWDYSTNTMAQKVPLWYHQQSNNDLLDWKFVFNEMERENVLDEFLSPSNLQLEVTDDKYSEYNRFVANKIRTHLSILLGGYHAIFNDQSALSSHGYPVNTILAKLESRITSLVIRYCVNRSMSQQIDIFDAHFERTFWNTDKEELLPQIGNALNRFSKENKNRVLKELINTDQIVRCFKLLEYVVSEKDKSQLLSVLNEQEIEEFFSQTYIRTDAEYVLQQLAENKAFAEKAKDALLIWEKAKIKSSHALNDQHEINCFRMKLLLAYHELDEEKINQVPDPAIQSHYSISGFSAAGSRDFYRALIYISKNRAQEAYSIFDSLMKTGGSDRQSLALNRFAARIRWADDTSNIDERKRIYQEAIDEWIRYENSLSRQTELEFVKDIVWLNKLHVYSALEDYKAFDEVFNKLEKPTQLSSHFLELHVKTLLNRKMQIQAETVLSEAEEYHRLADGSVPDFILTLNSLADNEDVIKVLREQYLRIFSRSPESLIKILPHKFTKEFDLPGFILNELTDVATDVLTYINSVSAIKKEDKYSDLFVLALSNRFKNYAWYVGNARGGYPESGKLNPGEIDFAIFGPTQKITICEALILKGKNVSNVERHNFKIFNYDPARKYFFTIVYYLGEENKFHENWNGYKADLSSVIEFPSGFELNGSIVDLTMDFGNDSIKAGKSIHGANTILYHIFININYHKKKPGKKKKVVEPDVD